MMNSDYLLKRGIVLFLLIISVRAMAHDLGVWGHVYPIAETDFLQFIHQRLLQMQHNGQLQQAKNQLIRHARHHALRPTPVAGLTTTTTPHTLTVDPSFVLRHDIHGAYGRLLYRQGTRINPLDHDPFTETWLFFNADDLQQLHWAQQQLATHTGRVKPILVQGNIRSAIKALNHRVYFDQQGSLSHHFGLQHIPCVLRAKGDRLVITEISRDQLSQQGRQDDK